LIIIEVSLVIAVCLQCAY